MRLLSRAPRRRRSSGGLGPGAAAPAPRDPVGPGRDLAAGSGRRCQGRFIGIHGRVGRAAWGCGRGAGAWRGAGGDRRAQMPG